MRRGYPGFEYKGNERERPQWNWRPQGCSGCQYRSKKEFHSIKPVGQKGPFESSNVLKEHDQ